MAQCSLTTEGVYGQGWRLIDGIGLLAIAYKGQINRPLKIAARWGVGVLVHGLLSEQA